MVWKLREANQAVVSEISESFNLDPLIARVIANRGISSVAEAEKYLYGTLDNLYSPFALPDMAPAVERIMQAIVNGEKIAIYGDYDVDGITSICLLSHVIRQLRGTCDYYLPNRIDEGYGISSEGIDRCAEQGARLIVSVDCGINSHSEVEYAGRLGIDIIITDHHEPGQSIPDCVAVIDPKRKDSTYPFQDLAGIGVAFKLVSALVSYAEQQQLAPVGSIDITDMLDIVALGTVADVVPLLDENRLLVKAGLAKLGSTKKTGLVELKKLSNISGQDIHSYDIAFRLGPRLNAVGRLGSARLAVELLQSEDSREAFNLASTLEKNNRERQKIEQEIFDEAIAMINADPDMERNRGIILYSERWHQGVVGIVASRIAKKYYKPTIIIAIEEDEGKGSARSIDEFHILDGIVKCTDLLETYGGHKLAAGFSIKKDKLDEFRHRFYQIVDQTLSEDDMVPKIKVDVEIDLSQVTLQLIDKLHILDPIGQGNPQPIFVSRSLFLRSLPRVVGRNHLKIWFEDKDRTVEAIAFNMADRLNSLSDTRIPYDIAYVPKINSYYGTDSIQLVIRDICPSGSEMAAQKRTL